ncbi:hypothetical protein CTZ28_45765 [Streptomyces shenzhenensis]|uniref:Uncharacterized protein n=2 Tax=Streptomyces shenzhenensis TaxID=943815 RepID=A0A3M0IC30_9ACTN|nr:hypothetical protein CTZ28_45765 [Streptomyces shenzhenensis]
MGRISEDTQARNEEAIRAAMDRLLRGNLSPGGKCDLRALASEAGVPRTAFHAEKNRDGTARPGPYQHLAQEFERHLSALRGAGSVPDPRTAQIEKLKDFKRRALSQIAAQHLEIERLREQAAAVGNVGRLPSGRSGTAPYRSCS